MELTGENRKRFEEWLEAGGREKLLEIARKTRSQDPESLVQTALARGAMAAPWRRFDPTKGTVDHIMEKILYGKLIDELRRGNNDVLTHRLTLNEEWWGEDNTDTLELRLDLQNAIGSLEEPYRTAFDLVVVRGMTMQEAGKQLGMSPMWVNYKVMDARRMLQEKLSAYAGKGKPRESDNSLPEISQRLAA